MTTYKIALENIRLYGYHGATNNERELGQRFEVDVEITADLSDAVANDDMKRTINYEHVFRLVESEVVRERHHLLETLAARLARDIAEKFGATEVLVRIRKPSVPIAGAIDHVRVEVVHRV
ncbi:MAG: dihydroneopterin aldolase [Candidatus Eisenbacteria bacterium]|nr:dihydroneopterin aldolase [Candidatus Eisenbacteria bacterium]